LSNVVNGVLFNAVTAVPGPSDLAPLPPMGWMSWEIFRCHVNCSAYPDACINQGLYEGMTDRIVDDGYLEVGYNQVSVDDCWANKSGRDGEGRLFPDPSRFPSGMKALGDYMHQRGVRFGTYTDEGWTTCKHYPGSQDYEEVDAATFASWGVDYLKVDGCHRRPPGMAIGYPAMGAALRASGRNITYSCSWPAYLGGNESGKPFGDMIDAGCNLWRNWDDIQCGWGSAAAIIDHWGDYGETLVQWAGPGHWHDMDMLLIGAGCLTLEEERTQMAIWSISASPLIMGNDLRKVSDASRAILLNKQAIAVSQDILGKMGRRHPSFTSISPTQVWSRPLARRDVAVGLYNKNDLSGADITVKFSDLDLSGQVAVLDIWSGESLGVFVDSFTSKQVRLHDTAFLRLSPMARITV